MGHVRQVICYAERDALTLLYQDTGVLHLLIHLRVNIMDTPGQVCSGRVDAEWSKCIRNTGYL